jgi:tetratricopeptide (TPR) repeat protein
MAEEPGKPVENQDAIAYQALTRAYAELRVKNYDGAVADFTEGIRLSPHRADIRKDLAYTLLKIGENEAARDQFGEAMRLNPADTHVALEYAFLSFESVDRTSHGEAIAGKAVARRIFDRVRHDSAADDASRASAEQAFHNIDGPLEANIERWKQALATGPETFSAHFELAEQAEQRDELELAVEHYRRAWQMLPVRKGVLLDLGRVLVHLNRMDEGNAALLAASRGGEPRAAEFAKGMLPDRYPFVYEFRRALELDPHNIELHRELAYLLLRMADRNEVPAAEAENEFRIIVDSEPADLLSAAQLGFLYLGRNETVKAAPVLKRVLDGGDEELANRVRVALHLPQQLRRTASPDEAAAEARIMADKSIQAGYLKDALKFLKIAHDADPVDFSLILKLASVYNMLHDDRTAMRWYALAKQSEDDAVAGKAATSINSLRPSTEDFRTTVWSFPMFSTRWHDLFSYAQMKTDMKLKRTNWFRPYISLRFIGDTRETLQGSTASAPQYLSESSFITAVGVASKPVFGATAWAEAGESIGYLTDHAIPDYRGGVTWSRSRGENIFSKERGFFFETNDDLVYVSRFDHDTLGYTQNRAGYTPATLPLQTQLFWNLNFTGDLKRQYWANFAETGPGVRFHWNGTPDALTVTVSALRGVYMVNQGNPRKPNFDDVRIGAWYALTH